MLRRLGCWLAAAVAGFGADGSCPWGAAKMMAERWPLVLDEPEAFLARARAGMDRRTKPGQPVLASERSRYRARTLYGKDHVDRCTKTISRLYVCCKGKTHS